jgi:hypothetical protein
MQLQEVIEFVQHKKEELVVWHFAKVLCFSEYHMEKNYRHVKI